MYKAQTQGNQELSSFAASYLRCKGHSHVWVGRWTFDLQVQRRVAALAVTQPAGPQAEVHLRGPFNLRAHSTALLQPKPLRGAKGSSRRHLPRVAVSQVLEVLPEDGGERLELVVLPRGALVRPVRCSQPPAHSSTWHEPRNGHTHRGRTTRKELRPGPARRRADPPPPPPPPSRREQARRRIKRSLTALRTRLLLPGGARDHNAVS